jgi:hypothetical protein
MPGQRADSMTFRPLLPHGSVIADLAWEVGLSLPSEVPHGHNVYRFSETAEFPRLLQSVGLEEVGVAEHTTVYSVPDTQTLWRGGLGSLVLTGAAIRHKDDAVQDMVRAAFERRAGIYKSEKGLDIPGRIQSGTGPEADLMYDREKSASGHNALNE